MRTALTLILVLLMTWGSQAQFNLDSLRNRIETSNDWTKSVTIKYSNQPFQRFKNLNRNESYDLYLDSEGNLNEYIGVSVIYSLFDNKNRVIKRIGYNLKGDYYFWDYSPIEITEYNKDTTIVIHYNNQSVLTDRTLTIKDHKDRVIEIQSFDKELNRVSKITYEYNDLKDELFIKTYGSTDKIRWQKFDSTDKKIIIEERFYDDKMNLIDEIHDLSNSDSIKCYYSIVKREIKNGTEKVSYYNSKDQLQCESDGFSIWTIK